MIFHPLWNWNHVWYFKSPPLGIILISRLILHTSFKYHISGCTICVNSLCNIIFFCWIYWKCIPVILLKLVYYCTIKRHWYTSPKHLSEAFFREKLNLTVLWCNFFDGFFLNHQGLFIIQIKLVIHISLNKYPMSFINFNFDLIISIGNYLTPKQSVECLSQFILGKVIPFLTF